MNIPLILTQSFWRDEAFTMLISIKTPWEIIQALIHDQSPPLYFLTLHYWIQLFGTGEYEVRLLSVVFYLGLAVLMFFITGEYIKNWLGRVLVSMTILSNPLLIQYAAEARPYMMYTFLTTLGVYFLLKRWYVFSGMVFGLATCTHNFGLFNLTAVLLWWVYEYRENLKQSLPTALRFFIPAGILSGLWSIVTIFQFSRITSNFWLSENTLNMFVDMLETFTRGEIWHQTSHVLYLLSLLLIVVGSSYFIAPRKKQLTQLVTLAMHISIIPICLTYLVSRFTAPIYYDRYLLASLPMIIVALSYGVTKLWEERRFTRIGLGALIGVYLITAALSASQVAQTSIKPPINWAVGEVLRLAQPGDSIVTEDVINFLEAKWYARGNEKNVSTFTVFQGDDFPYFLGISAFDPEDVKSVVPENTNLWVIQIDGGFHKYTPGEVLSSQTTN